LDTTRRPTGWSGQRRLVVAHTVIGLDICLNLDLAKTGWPSVVRAPPSNAPIATTATTTAKIHPPIVRQGCRALAGTIVESFIGYLLPLPTTIHGDVSQRR
jgi:hypothetical protein